MTARWALFVSLLAYPLWAQGNPAPPVPNPEAQSALPGASAPAQMAEGDVQPSPTPTGGIDTSGQNLATLRDPFRRPVFEDPNVRPRTELEYFPLEQYRMVGVLTGPEKLRAMLVGPNGKTYFVSENMKIGVRKGVIRKITPLSMIVREQVLNTIGREEVIDSELRLPGER